MRNLIFDFIDSIKYAVIATASLESKPESAVMGIVIDENLSLFFDTTTETRKYKNLLVNREVSFVIGGTEGEITVQYDGIAQEMTGQRLEEWKNLYFKKFPDGKEREKWPHIIYYEVIPRWIRYSDYGQEPPFIEEIRF